jgi:glycosyltransferase involved in cell wall biosynthesis
MKSYIGLVFPSLFLETQGGVVAEAFAACIPVLARAGSAGADWVMEYSAGVVSDFSQLDFKLALESVEKNRNELRRRSYDAYLARFTEQAWVENTGTLIQSLVGVQVG